MKNEEWENSHRKKWMTDDQFECYRFMADIHGGFNHMFGKVRNIGLGIRFESTSMSHFATHDYDRLTRAVVLAHDRMIRFSVVPAKKNKIGMTAFKRHSREGDVCVRHPTIEQAIQKIRGE